MVFNKEITKQAQQIYNTVPKDIDIFPIEGTGNIFLDGYSLYINKKPLFVICSFTDDTGISVYVGSDKK